MTLFLIIWGCVSLYLVFNTRYKILCNEVFWLSIFWTFIIGCYITSGITYKQYGLSFPLVIFFSCCSFAFIKGRDIGYKRTPMLAKHRKGKFKTNLFTALGVFGAFLFVFDLYRLNGVTVFLARESGIKMELDISLLGSIGCLLVPILLVQGLYSIAYSLREKGKFSVEGLILLMGYTIPCILNSGRESILYVIIGVISLYGYSFYFKSAKTKKYSFKQIFTKLLIVVVVGSLSFAIISISEERFDQTRVNIFLSENNVPSATMEDAKKWGEMEFLYYNIASYFSHQVAMLDFTLKDYDGPYMCGMYEFNIVSRRLPESWGLDYRQVPRKIRKLYGQTGVDFGGGWNTILGVFIIDLGRIGAILACFLCGLIIGKSRKRFEISLEPRYAVLISLICLSTFSTIQMGPFYQTLIYGSYIWWYVIFHTKSSHVKVNHNG